MTLLFESFKSNVNLIRYIYNCSFIPGVGHYTQMVWADTEAVGCGFLTTKDVTMKEDIERMKAEETENWVESVSIIF